MELILIQSKIYEIRGQRVMLDYDLAEMYRVETRILNQAVKRNMRRFPSDFMFRLSMEEWEDMLSQFVMTYPSKRPKKAMPYAFTEQGVAMLSGLLNSEIAIDMNIRIMRAFVAMRNVLTFAKEENVLPALIDRIKALEEVSEETLAAINDLSEDTQKEFDDIYIALTELAAKHKQVNKPRNPIGFRKPEN
ncbi:hypothetical protein M2137_001723 [Parabacteroides sp. PFB2-10]|uniref:ORF6N domain-containing protein n=1 Tax=Parabacteroides sp. PFB2-10 TaxID=1742405 RepID=UPI002473FFF5|nr:ORF6N domain-containing protein [Parabacteroides sp. PFB2-10]MDH6312938.1 hypothetical protein [Parabacteroides sp. PFB2-10]